MNKNILSATPKSPMAKAKRLMELQALVKSVKPEIDELKADLLKVTQDLGVLTLRTELYTISRAKRITPEVVDFKAVEQALKDQNIPYGTKVVFADYMTLTFKKLIEDKREIDGLEAKETEYISVRIREKKEDIVENLEGVK